MHSEEESLSGQRLSKDHSWRITEINWVSGAENFNEKIVKPHLHHMLFGRVPIKMFLAHPKSYSAYIQHIQLSDTNRSSNETGFCGQMK